MFNTIIDAIQDSKKTFVNTFITDDKFKAELVKLVDLQTEFAKGQANASLSIAEAFVNKFNNTVYPKKAGA
jgi:hypothetical protein